jgi:hypothetical protein
VDQVAPGGGGHARQMLLLPAHPLDAVARTHRYHLRLHVGDEVDGGLAVDERRQAQVLDRRQAGNQLARVGLHPAGLAGHHEDQVEADLDHDAAAPRSTRSS